MIDLTAEQWQAMDRGGPVQACLAGRSVVLLRTKVLRRAQALVDMERAVIEAGHTRGPTAAPAQLEAIELPAESLGDVAVLAGERFEEIQELVADDRVHSAWGRTVAAAHAQWARENSS